MITPVTGVINLFSYAKSKGMTLQEAYDDYFDKHFLPSMHLVKCPNEKCNGVGNFSLHGRYGRNYGIRGNMDRIKLHRTRCNDCGTTHAVLPICFIPYSAIPADECCEIIHMRLNENRSYAYIAAMFNIDKRIVKRLIKRFIKEHLDDHLRIFKTLKNLRTICYLDIEKFLTVTKQPFLVSKRKLKHLHYTFTPYSLIPFP